MNAESRHDGKAAGRILVVDDHAETRQLFGCILRRRGFEVLEADGGRAGLDLAQTLPFDLVLLDVMMPDLNGFEVCARLKEAAATAALPIVFVTALDDSDTRRDCLALGAADLIVKPVSPQELVQRVRSCLAQAESPEPLSHAPARGDAGAPGGWPLELGGAS